VAGVKDAAKADEDNVAGAIAMVTLFGTVAMVVLPLLQAPIALSDRQFGIWAGASVHEVGQVVGAAGPAGAGVAVAIVIKLTRVLMLAPVVATVGLIERRASRSAPDFAKAQTPPLVPQFVAGFVACVGLRSTGWIPASAIRAIETAQMLALAAALFGIGTAVRFRSLLRGAGPVLAVSAMSTVMIAGVSLAGHSHPHLIAAQPGPAGHCWQRGCDGLKLLAADVHYSPTGEQISRRSTQAHVQTDMRWAFH
jgi:uncharacterized membrane protein YadS